MNSPEPQTKKELDEQLKIVRNRVHMRTNELGILDKKVVEADQKLADTQQMIKDLQRELIDARKTTDATKKEANEKLKEQKEALYKVETDIKERKKYLLEQEEIVNVAVAEMNDRLLALKSEISTTDNLKDTSVRELADLNTAKLSIDDEYRASKDATERLQAFYDDQVAKIKIEIRELQGEKQRADMNLKQTKREAADIIRRLSEKERQLDLRDQTLAEVDAKQAAEAEYLRKKRTFLATQ